MFTRPDNSVYPSAILSSDIDIAELAARLGINRLRRSGRVVFYDDFSDGLAWQIPTTPGIVTVAGGIKPFTPPGMMNILPVTANPTSALFSLPIISTPKVGYEITYRLDDAWLPGLVDTLDFRVDGNGHNFALRYELATPKWQFWRGVWSDISGAAAAINYNAWHNLKFTVNFDTGKYMKFYYNRNIYDISYGAAAASAADNLVFSITATDAAARAGVYVDNVIITIDGS